MRRGGGPLAFVLPLLVLAAALGSAPAVAAEDPRESSGRALFVKGEYQSALEIYATLFAERNDPLYLRNIGRCFQKLRQPRKAIESFREYLRRTPRLKASERREIEGFIREMEALKAEQDAESPRSSSSAAVQPPPAGAGTASVAGNGNSRATSPPADTISGSGAAASSENRPVTRTATTSNRTLAASAATGAGAGTKPKVDPPSLIDRAPAGGARQQDEDRSVLKRWWFWTGVGAVIVGGVAAAVLLRGGGATRPDCAPGFTCPH